MFDDSPVISEIGTVSAYYLNAVPIEVEYCSIEVAILSASSCGCTVGATPSSQSGGVEVAHSC